MENKFASIKLSERKLLSIIFNAPEMAVNIFAKLNVDDFSDEKNKKVLEIVKELFDEGKLTDYNTIINRLSHKELNYVGGVEALNEILNDFTTTKNWEELLRSIIDFSVSNKISGAITKILQKMALEPHNVNDYAKEINSKVLEYTNTRNHEDLKNAKQIVEETLSKIEKVWNNKNEITGTTTGYTYLDRITSGFQRGDLIILAARPGMGKTAFALNLFINAAKAANKNNSVFFASLEMPYDQLTTRIFASEGSIDIHKLRTGTALTENDLKRLHVIKEQLSDLNFYIDDSSTITINSLQSTLRKLNNEKKLDLVVIDYLQLITSTNNSSKENRQQEVSYFSRTLKSLARELDVPIIALSQLSRKVEAREDKKPLLSDLRESGAIEQDADLIMFLYRDDYYDNAEESENPNDVIANFGKENNPAAKKEKFEAPMEIIISKHRNGQTGSVKLAFTKKSGKFSNFS